MEPNVLKKADEKPKTMRIIPDPWSDFAANLNVFIKTKAEPMLKDFFEHQSQFHELEHQLNALKHDIGIISIQLKLLSEQNNKILNYLYRHP